MLYGLLRDAYDTEIEKLSGVPGVAVAARSRTEADRTKTQGRPVLLSTDVKTFLSNDVLREEAFGPSSLFVAGESKEELLQAARALDGSLTATVHGTPDDCGSTPTWSRSWSRRSAGSCSTGFPTGVEVVPSQQHGGPYPSTTDARTTSVGTAAVQRFVRPVAYQDFPQEACRLNCGTRTRSASGGFSTGS
jgi:NADP-dependent aldehyde dehydrogenase